MTATKDNLWFMTAQLLIHSGAADNDDGLSIIEHRMARDFAPPLHVHQDETETFVMLEGRVRFERDGERFEAGAGETVVMPKGSAHGFRVLSETGRFLTITRGPFEAMVRAASRPADGDCLPPQLPPTPEQQQALTSLCANHGIAFLGAPIA